MADVVLYSLHRDSHSTLTSDWPDALRLTVSLLFLPRFAREIPLPYKKTNIKSQAKTQSFEEVFQRATKNILWICNWTILTQFILTYQRYNYIASKQLIFGEITIKLHAFQKNWPEKIAN